MNQEDYKKEALPAPDNKGLFGTISELEFALNSTLLKVHVSNG
jgi:hypothetical protein